MAYRLDLGEHAETSLRRCAIERIEDAIAQLDTKLDQDPRSAVHEARKDAKKARALLRLCRSDLGGATYRTENSALRDAARALSAMRDNDVLLDTIDGLADRYAGRLPKGSFDALHERLHEESDSSASDEENVAVARSLLTGVAGRVEHWPLSDADASSLHKALERSYARGRRALEQAEQDASDDRLHEWRKRVKDLRYQQQLLRDAWPQLLGAQAKAAKELAELLGIDHDLAVLEQRIRNTGAPAADVEGILTLVAQRRLEIQDDAFRLGRRVFAESPKRFARRVGSYLRSAVGERQVEAVA
jgi:CHAD domain-containing protein